MCVLTESYPILVLTSLALREQKNNPEGAEEMSSHTTYVSTLMCISYACALSWCAVVPVKGYRVRIACWQALSTVFCCCRDAV